MKIDIYPSAIKRDKYLAVPHGTDFGSWKASVPVDPDLKKVRPLLNTVDIQPGQSRIGGNSDDVLAQIGQQGWAGINASIIGTIGGTR
jgi:hypothetical protein